eukprot:403367851
MTNRLMNSLFNFVSNFHIVRFNSRVDQMLSPQGAQRLMAQELKQREALRERRYKHEILEIETNDILDRALVKAKAHKELGAIDAPTYHEIVDKVTSLKKLKFTFDYEDWKDKDMLEWMKYKVAAEVGGDEEIAAFERFEKIKLDQKGENGYRLWREQIERDPQAQRFIPYM